MYKKAVTRTLVVFIYLLLLFCCTGCRHDRVLATYDFPVKPGTADWKAFGTHQEMLNACRIPEKVLTQLSTEGLIETMLNYPLLFEIFAFNTPQQGIDAVTAQFNGFQELFTRDDRCARLINKYESMDIRPQIDGLSAVAQVNTSGGFPSLK